MPGFEPFPYSVISSYTCSPGTQQESRLCLWHTEFHGSNNPSCNKPKSWMSLLTTYKGVSDILMNLEVLCLRTSNDWQDSGKNHGIPTGVGGSQGSHVSLNANRPYSCSISVSCQSGSFFESRRKDLASRYFHSCARDLA